MEEIGVTNVADPLGGSWYVEALTDKIEAEAEEIFARIKEMSPDGTMTGGILRGIEDGWFMAEIADAAFEYQQKLEKGEKKIVGVNTLTDTVSGELEILRVSHEVEVEQCRVLAARKAQPRRGPGTAYAGGSGRGGQGDWQPDRAHAGGGACGGHDGGNLSRSSGRMGRVPRARPVLSRAYRPSRPRPAGCRQRPAHRMGGPSSSAVPTARCCESSPSW